MALPRGGYGDSHGFNVTAHGGLLAVDEQVDTMPPRLFARVRPDADSSPYEEAGVGIGVGSGGGVAVGVGGDPGVGLGRGVGVGLGGGVSPCLGGPLPDGCGGWPPGAGVKEVWLW